MTFPRAADRLAQPADAARRRAAEMDGADLMGPVGWLMPSPVRDVGQRRKIAVEDKAGTQAQLISVLPRTKQNL
jgi:hypothetical protein